MDINPLYNIEQFANKPYTRNPVLNISRLADVVANNPELYNYYNDIINRGYGYSPTNSISDVGQYAKPIDSRTTRVMQGFSDALGDYVKRTLIGYDNLTDAIGNPFNRKSVPTINKNSILRGTSSIPVGIAAEELLTGYPSLKELGKSIIGTGVRALNRISPYFMIYEGLNQPTATDQQMWDAYNNWQIQNSDNPVLQGGVQYYD